MKKKFFTFMTLILFVLVSCENSSEPDSCDLEAYAQALINWRDARTVYIENSSVENCNAYRIALQAYINIGENCDQFTDLIESRRQELNSLTCN